MVSSNEFTIHCEFHPKDNGASWHWKCKWKKWSSFGLASYQFSEPGLGCEIWLLQVWTARLTGTGQESLALCPRSLWAPWADQEVVLLLPHKSICKEVTLPSLVEMVCHWVIPAFASVSFTWFTYRCGDTCDSTVPSRTFQKHSTLGEFQKAFIRLLFIWSLHADLLSV